MNTAAAAPGRSFRRLPEDIMNIGLPEELLHLEAVRSLHQGLGRLYPEVRWHHSQPRRSEAPEVIISEGDACFPFKKTIRTSCSLAGRADALLVPRLVRLDGYLMCPNFRGLPDLVALNLERSSSEPRRPPLISPLIDEQGPGGRRGSLKQAMEALSGTLGLEPQLDPALALTEASNPEDQSTACPGKGCIALLGHPYMLGDKRLNSRIPEIIRSRGYRTITPESVPFARLDRLASERDYYAKTLYWRFARETLGGYIYFSREQPVSGIIFLVSFNCGLDALLRVELAALHRRSEQPVPLLTHVSDEHTQQEHVVTRIEAFLDILDGLPHA